MLLKIEDRMYVDPEKIEAIWETDPIDIIGTILPGKTIIRMKSGLELSTDIGSEKVMELYVGYVP